MSMFYVCFMMWELRTGSYEVVLTIQKSSNSQKIEEIILSDDDGCQCLMNQLGVIINGNKDTILLELALINDCKHLQSFRGG